MKTDDHCFKKVQTAAIFSILIILLTSCSTYYFSQPQPVDGKNIYEFPQIFIGHWIDANDTLNTTANLQPVSIFDNDSSYQPIVWKIEDADPLSATPLSRDSTLYEVGKNCALLIVHQKEKIVKGSWPKLHDGKLQYPDETYSVLNSIYYDSILNPIDTVCNFIFRGNLVYKIEDNYLLAKGYRFDSTSNEITVFKNDTIGVDLGRNAFLKMLDENRYALNIRYRAIGDDNNWWLLLILEKLNNGSVNIWQCSVKSGQLPSMFYSRPSRADEYFFDSQWSRSEMLQLMKKGYFEVTNTLIRCK